MRFRVHPSSDIFPFNVPTAKLCPHRYVAANKILGWFYVPSSSFIGTNLLASLLLRYQPLYHVGIDCYWSFSDITFYVTPCLDRSE